MVFGFSKKTAEESGEEDELIEQLDALQMTTEQIEAEKEAKRIAREERKFLKEIQKKKKQRERMIAPFLLLMTIIISMILWVIYAK